MRKLTIDRKPPVEMADDGDRGYAANLHERFTAKDEVIEILHSLEHVHTDIIKKEKAIERFTCKLFQYYLVNMLGCICLL